jgi:uncharacterized membrane protein
MFDIGAIFKEAALVLRNNHSLAIPTIITILAVSLVSLAVMPSPEDTSKVLLLGFTSMLLSLFAHGVTLAMAREALETGSTSLSTAYFIAFRLFVTLISVSFVMIALVVLGSILFLLPGIIAAFLLMFAMPSIVVDSAGALEALGRSYAVVRANMKESAMFFAVIVLLGLTLGIFNLIITTVPVVGQLISLALSGAFGGFVSVVTVRAYKTLSVRARVIQNL